MSVTLGIDEVPPEMLDLMPANADRLSVEDYILLLSSLQGDSADTIQDEEVCNRVIEDMLQNIEYLALQNARTIFRLICKVINIKSPKSDLLLEAICMQISPPILNDVVIDLVKQNKIVELAHIVYYITDIDSLLLEEEIKEMLKSLKSDNTKRTIKFRTIIDKIKGDTRQLTDWVNDFTFQETVFANINMCLNIDITNAEDILLVLRYLFSINYLKPYSPKVVDALFIIKNKSRNFGAVIAAALDLKIDIINAVNIGNQNSEITDFIDLYADADPESDVIKDVLTEEDKEEIKFMLRYFEHGFPALFFRQIINNIGNVAGKSIKSQIIKLQQEANLDDLQLAELLANKILLNKYQYNIYITIEGLTEYNEWLVNRGLSLGDFSNPADIIEDIEDLVNSKQDEKTINNILFQLLATESATKAYSDYIAIKYSADEPKDNSEFFDLIWQYEWVRKFFIRLNIPENIAKDILLALSDFDASYLYYQISNLVQDYTNGPGNQDKLSILKIFRFNYEHFFNGISNAVNILGIEGFIQVYKIFGIRNFHRYDPGVLLHQLKNWQQGKITYKYISISGTGDYNTAFSDESNELIKSVLESGDSVEDIVFFEADSKFQASKLARLVGNRERQNGRNPKDSQQITNVIINVHGSPTGVTFSRLSKLSISDFNIAKDFIESPQGKLVNAKVKDYTRDLGKYRVILSSCLTARPSATGYDNFASTMQSYFMVVVFGSDEEATGLKIHGDKVVFITEYGPKEAIKA